MHVTTSLVQDQGHNQISKFIWPFNVSALYFWNNFKGFEITRHWDDVQSIIM